MCLDTSWVTLRVTRMTWWHSIIADKSLECIWIFCAYVPIWDLSHDIVENMMNEIVLFGRSLSNNRMKHIQFPHRGAREEWIADGEENSFYQSLSLTRSQVTIEVAPPPFYVILVNKTLSIKVWHTEKLIRRIRKRKLFKGGSVPRRSTHRIWPPWWSS